ncbi:hypothetical protein ACG93T_17080 [Acinetobacter beijerinckii]|uniref:hypothetical protein n=1 Tax=Acinetobacter beijerinckii TaxID=262668 RepID=UPI003AF8AFB7
MQFIEKTILMQQINDEISKLSNYDPDIEIIDISVNANGFINYFLISKQFDIPSVIKAQIYVEQVEHLFNGKYNKLI